jgi:WD40 repeat protein
VITRADLINVLLVPILGGLLFGVWWCCSRLYHLAIRKGYPPAVAGLVTGGAAGVGWAAGLACALLDTSHWSEAARSALAFSVIFVFPVLAATITVLVLPRRNARRAGPRQTDDLFSRTADRLENPGCFAAGLLMLVGVATMVVSLFFIDYGLAISTTARRIEAAGLLAVPLLILGGVFDALGSSSSFMLGFLIFCLSFLGFLPTMLSDYYRARAELPTFEQVLSDDSRPAVLYLRAFLHESDAFIWGASTKVAPYRSRAADTKDKYLDVTFEEYLHASFAAQIGPFVALGDPTDALPQEGAARLYARDEDWQQQFLALAATAAAIVMHVNRSEALGWELATIRRQGWQTKLFVITPPIPRWEQVAFRPMWEPVAYLLIDAAKRAAKGIPVTDWNSFRADLHAAGLQSDPDSPGPGAVVSFDPAGRARIITRDAIEPDEFVTPIRRDLTITGEDSRRRLQDPDDLVRLEDEPAGSSPSRASQGLTTPESNKPTAKPSTTPSRSTLHESCAEVRAEPMPVKTFDSESSGMHATAAAFSPDGRWLALVGDDKKVLVIDVSTWGISFAARHGGWVDTTVVAAAFSPDSRRLATSSWDRTARIWDTSTGEELLRLKHRDIVEGVSFDADGQRLATASKWMARIWATHSGRELLRITDCDVNAVAFSPNGLWLATACRDTARIRDASSSQELLQLKHGDWIGEVTFSQDGRWLATTSHLTKGGSAQIWDTSNGKLLHKLVHDGGVSGAAFSPDGRWLATAGDDGNARIWDTSNGKLLHKLQHDHGVRGVAFRPKGRWLATVSLGDVTVWRL